MLRNLGIISTVLFTSQLLAIVQQCASRKSTTWSCKNDKLAALHVLDDRSKCHCLFAPRFDLMNFGDGYNTHGDGSAYKIHTVGKIWNEARKICHSEGAHLAVINSKRELEVLNNLYNEAYTSITFTDVKYDDYAYLGVHKHFGDEWTTVIGGKSKWIKPDDFVPWNQKKCGRWGIEPSNGPQQRCGALIRPCKTMDDTECDEKLPFICEKPAPCS